MRLFGLIFKQYVASPQFALICNLGAPQGKRPIFFFLTEAASDFLSLESTRDNDNLYWCSELRF